MKLCVDIGNTKVKAALFKADNLVESKNFDSQQELLLWAKRINVSKIIFSSVGKKVEKNLIEENFPDISVVYFSHQTPIILKNNYETPETLGLDRLAAAVGGTMLYPNINTLVIDAGTCITFDFVDADNIYKGGSIHPGIYMRAKAMHSFTQRLPMVKINSQVPFVSANTQNCLQAGAFWGTVSEIEKMIERYEQLGALSVLLTGGDAELLANAIKKQIFVRPLLVLEGLNQILDWNA